MSRCSLDGRGVWGRMDTWICTAESLHCSPESITTLLIDCILIQNKKFKKKKDDASICHYIKFNGLYSPFVSLSSKWFQPNLWHQLKRPEEIHLDFRGARLILQSYWSSVWLMRNIYGIFSETYFPYKTLKFEKGFICCTSVSL